MPAQPDVLQSCLQDAAMAARPALERCIDQAVAALQAAEMQSMKVADRDELARAWREFLKHKAGWSMQYPADLLVVFKANALAASHSARDGVPPTPSRMGSLESTSQFASIDNFSLVDDADITQAIESARLLQQMLPPVEQVLAELNSLVSTLQGLPNVRPDLNPLRPEAFAQALRSMIGASAAEPELASVWLRQISIPLGGELRSLYEALVRQLEQAHIQGASYRVLQTPASASRPRPGGTAAAGTGPGDQGGAGGPASDEAGALTPSRYADLSDYGIRDELFQDFLFHGGSHAQHRLAPAYYAAVDQELAGLQSEGEWVAPPGSGELPAGYQDVPAVDRPQRTVSAGSHLDAQRWGDYGQPRHRAMVRTQLKKKAERVGQVLGLEVVRKLVSQVAQDHRLLLPVREAIVALEPALLRMAMQDPRFFSDEAHPGRRLMERVAQRSFRYNDEFGADFLSFFERVSGTFNALNHQEVNDARPFASALAGLQDVWDGQDQQEQQQRNDVLGALRFAEERQSQADQIAFDLSARSDLDKVPALVLDFLFGPWSLAMAHARLVDTRHQVDPMGFGSAVPDLLWSVKQEVTLKRPAKLIEMIPSLLGKLHAGLELLGQSPQESESFFEALMRLHRPVLQLRRVRSRQDAEESGAMLLEPSLPGPLDAEAAPATPEQRRARPADAPWLGRMDLDAAGFEDTLPSAPGELAWHDDEAAGTGDTDAGQFDWEEENQAETESLSTRAQLLASTGPPGRRRRARTAARTAPEDGRAASEAVSVSAFAEMEAAPPLSDVSARQGTAAVDGDGHGLRAGPEAGRMATPGVEAEPASAAAGSASLGRADTERLMQDLRTGQWVDLYSHHEWLRAQLVWASSKGTLFMFVSHGGQPHSMTKRSCERLIAGRLLRPVDTHGVVAQALDAVAAQASPPQHDEAADAADTTRHYRSSADHIAVDERLMA